MMKSPFETQSSQEKWNHGPSLGCLRGELKESPESRALFVRRTRPRDGRSRHQFESQGPWILPESLKGNLKESRRSLTLFGCRGKPGSAQSHANRLAGLRGATRLPLHAVQREGGWEVDWGGPFNRISRILGNWNP